MTLKEIAERIAYGQGQPFNRMLLENIKFSVRAWRAMLIRRDIAANGVSQEYMQRIYLDLKKVDQADACNFDTGSCGVILRTTNAIPQTVRFKSDVPFYFVGDVFGAPYTFTEYEEVPYTCYNKYTSKVFRYAYVNGYIYIFNNTKIKQVAIRDVFVDPFKANTLCSGECFNSDSEFPMPADMVWSVIDGMIKGELRMLQPVDDAVEIDETDSTISNVKNK